MFVLRFRPLGFYASAMAATTGAGNICTALSPRFGAGTEWTAAAGRPVREEMTYSAERNRTAVPPDPVSVL